MTITKIVKLPKDSEECENEIFNDIRGKRFFVIAEIEPQDGDNPDDVRHMMLSRGMGKIEVLTIMDLIQKDMLQQGKH